MRALVGIVAGLGLLAVTAKAQFPPPSGTAGPGTSVPSPSAMSGLGANVAAALGQALNAVNGLLGLDSGGVCSPSNGCYPVFNIMTYGAKCDGVTDDNAAITAAFAAMQTALGGVIAGPGGGKTCLIKSAGINATGFNFISHNAEINLAGTTIDCQVAGGVCVDALNSRFLHWRDFHLIAETGANEPAVGFQSGRASASASSDQDNYDGLFITGYYSQAALKLVGAEIADFKKGLLYNQDTGAAAYALILDGYNHFNVTSAFVTITLPVDTTTSFNNVHFSNFAIQQVGNNSPAVWVGNASGLTFDGQSYIETAFAGAAVVLYTEATGANSDLKFDAHFETSGLANIFQFAGAKTTPTVYGLRYHDFDPQVGTSVFSIGAETSATLQDLDVRIEQTFAGAPTLWDTASKYTINGGNVFLPSSAWWTAPAAFSGTMCDPTCTTFSNSLGTLTANGSSPTLTWTGLTGNEYTLRCGGIIPAGSGPVYVQFGEGGTPTWEVANYLWGEFGRNSSNSNVGGASASDSGLDLNAANDSHGTNYGVSATLHLHNLASSTIYKGVDGSVDYPVNGGAPTNSVVFGGRYTGDANPITAVRVNASSSASITAGTCTLRYLSD